MTLQPAGHTLLPVNPEAGPADAVPTWVGPTMRQLSGQSSVAPALQQLNASHKDHQRAHRAKSFWSLGFIMQSHKNLGTLKDSQGLLGSLSPFGPDPQRHHRGSVLGRKDPLRKQEHRGAQRHPTIVQRRLLQRQLDCQEGFQRHHRSRFRVPPGRNPLWLALPVAMWAHDASEL